MSHTWCWTPFNENDRFVLESPFAKISTHLHDTMAVHHLNRHLSRYLIKISIFEMTKLFSEFNVHVNRSCRILQYYMFVGTHNNMVLHCSCKQRNKRGAGGDANINRVKKWEKMQANKNAARIRKCITKTKTKIKTQSWCIGRNDNHVKRCVSIVDCECERMHTDPQQCWHFNTFLSQCVRA